MKQIIEDYVNYEIAVLLKEKGFNEEVRTFYNSNGKLEDCAFLLNHNLDIGSGFTSAPSQSLALKWLREVHNIEISISYGLPFIDGKQVFKYYWCPVKVTEKGLEYPMDDPNTAEFNEEMADSYEEAVEAALLYVLKNLI